MRCILSHQKTGAHDKINSGRAGLETMGSPGGSVGRPLGEGTSVPTTSGSCVGGIFCVVNEVCASCIFCHSFAACVFSLVRPKEETEAFIFFISS